MKENSQNTFPKLDELDLILIRELQQDARVNYLALASKLGVAHSTVSRRVTKLINRQVIGITPIIDHSALGYATTVVFAIKVAPGTVDAVAGQLVALSEVKVLWITAGHYDIVAVALYKDHQDYLRWLREETGNISENVKIETMLVLRGVNILAGSHGNAVVSHILPTELEISIIRELEKSPRAPVKELAANIGASFTSVRSTFRKLISRGIVRVKGIPNPAAFGYTVRGVTLAQVHPSKLHTVNEELKVYPPVNHVDLTFGAFNVVVWTSFQDSNQMSDFLSRDLGRMSGVASYESLVGLSIEKSPLGFVIEQQNMERAWS